MSGSGITTGGGAGSPTSGGCADIFVETTLASPNPEIIGKLKANEQLTLQLQGERGPLLAVTKEGEIAGSIASSSLARIIRCISEGYNFIAIVKLVSGGRCDIEIRPGG